MTKIIWTSEDLEKLKSIYPLSSKEDILNYFFPRKWSSIEAKALRIGLKREVNKKVEWSNIEIETIKKSYKYSSKEHFMSLLPNRTWKAIREKANSLGINREESLIKKDNVDIVRKNNLKKFGVEYNWQRDDIKEQIKKTNLERYGVEYPQQSSNIQEKTKENNLKNWGHECPLHSKELSNKIREEASLRHGVTHPSVSEEANLKRKETNLKVYGCENPFGNSEVKDKIRESLINNYGVDNPQKSEDIKVKTYQTNLERFGHEHPAQNEDIKTKTFLNNVEKYGVEYPTMLPEVKEKIKKTNLERYGVENPAQNEDILKKIKETNLEKYGATSVLALEEYRNRDKAFETMLKNKSFTRSKPEEHLLEFLRIVDPDIVHHKKHPEVNHVIDYYSPKYDTWIQFDGVYWHGKNTTEEKLRQDPRFNFRDSNASGIYNNIQNDKIQNENIPNLIRFWEDDFSVALKNNNVIKLIESKFLEKGISLNYSFLKEGDSSFTDISVACKGRL